MTRETVLINQGIQCLIDNLGIIGAEEFISLVLREQIDYTEWQREHYKDVTSEELYSELLEYANNNPR